MAEVALIINRAQQKLVQLAEVALKEKQENGCVCNGTLFDLARLNSIIDSLSWNASGLNYEDLERLNTVVNEIGGTGQLPYKDINLAFYNTSILYTSTGSINSVYDIPDYLSTTIGLINQYGSTKVTYINGGGAAYKGPYTPKPL